MALNAESLARKIQVAPGEAARVISAVEARVTTLEGESAADDLEFLGVYASETAIKAIAAAARQNGSVAQDATNDVFWMFDSGSSASASAWVLVPDAGTGRWLRKDPSLADLSAVTTGNGTALIGDEDPEGRLTATTQRGINAELGARTLQAAASEAAIKAIPAAARADGSMVVALDTSTLWTFDAEGAASASALVLVPDAGTGRWVRRATIELATKSFGFADLQEADQDIDVDFASALPAGALVIGGGFNVTAIFDNVGDTASVSAHLGIAGGDRDAFCASASLDAVAKTGGTSGAGMGTLVGAITPSIQVLPDVNGNTLTKGAAVAYLAYVLAF